MASISKLESYKDGLLCDLHNLFNLSSTAGTPLERGATSQLDTENVTDTHSVPQATAHSPLLAAAAALCVSAPTFTLGFAGVKVFLLAQKSLKLPALQSKQKCQSGARIW